MGSYISIDDLEYLENNLLIKKNDLKNIKKLYNYTLNIDIFIFFLTIIFVILFINS